MGGIKISLNGLVMVPIFLAKSHEIGTIKSEQGDFSEYLKLLVFGSASGNGF